MRVSIVLDRRIGPAAKTFAEAGPIWLVTSSENRRFVEELWATRPELDATIFDEQGGETAEEDCLAILASVEEHHPGWTVLQVVGAAPTPDLLGELHLGGPGSYDSAPGGFIYRRIASD